MFEGVSDGVSDFFGNLSNDFENMSKEDHILRDLVLVLGFVDLAKPQNIWILQHF